MAASKKCTEVMIDLETLNTVSNSVILSIGAVKFNRDGYIEDEAYYSAIALDHHQMGVRSISGDTLKWWMKQGTETQAVFQDKGAKPAPDVMHEFLEWLGPNAGSMMYWSNGADFDIPMVRHMMDQVGVVCPWPFWNHRCFRTMKSEWPGSAVPKPAAPKIAHNALDDAYAQAKHLQAIFAAIKEGKIDGNTIWKR